MSVKQLKKLIADAYMDITFKYKGIYGIIMPHGSGLYKFGWGDVDKEYDDLDVMLSDKNFGEKSLADIAEEIEEIELC